MHSPSPLPSLNPHFSLNTHLIDRLHDQALETATRYKNAEASLIEILQKIDEHRVFLKKGHPSLFAYVVGELGLSESVAYNLISVSRKAREIPELANEIRNGAITLSNARKIVPVLNIQNQSLWLEKARTLSQRQLEKEIVKVRPESATPERASYVTENRVRLELGLSEKDMLRLRRVQDLLSQAKRRPATLEEVLITLTEDYLKRHDPLERAKRQKVKNGLSVKGIGNGAKDLKIDLAWDTRIKPSESVDKPVSRPKPVSLPKREPIPANLRHQVNLRDQRHCTFMKDLSPNDSTSEARCNQTRWIEIHHKIPVSQGGRNTLENLVSLCSAHHRWLHSQ